jgi:hypothetical protein
LADRAWKLLKSSPGQQGNVLQNSTLRTQLILSTDEWHALLDVDVDAKFEQICKHVFDVAATAWPIDNPNDGSSLPLNNLLATYRDNTDGVQLDTLGKFVNWAVGLGRPEFISESATSLGMSEDDLRLGHVARVMLLMANVAAGIGTGVKALQQESADLIGVVANPASISAPDLRSRLDHASNRVAEAWQYSAATSLPAFWTPLSFPWPTLAFFSAIAYLVGRADGETGLINTISTSGDDADAQVVI